MAFDDPGSSRDLRWGLGWNYLASPDSESDINDNSEQYTTQRRKLRLIPERQNDMEHADVLAK